jgi:hypothetical protein
MKAGLALALILGSTTVSVAITRADSATAAPTACPRHFLSLAWTALQNCAAIYAPRGLSIHAFARNGGAFAGSFESGPPRKLDLSNLPWNPCSPIVAILDGEPDNVPTICGNAKGDSATQLVMLEVNYTNAGRAADIDVDPGDPKIRKRYVAMISSLAAKGLAPYRVVIHQKIGAGVSPEVGSSCNTSYPATRRACTLPTQPH